MIVCCDLETHYSQHYSLKKMTTAEYNLDHQFQSIMMSIKIGNNPTEVVVGEAAIASRLSQLDPDNTALLSHHINFDGSILYWHFGFTPKLYLCTLSMARAITHWLIGKSSLAAVSKFLDLPPKGDEVVRAIGKRLENFTPTELQSYAEYCIRDNENCRLIFDRLKPYFTNTELQVIDLVARMFILPQVKLNPHTLAQHLAEVQARKAEAFDRLQYVDRDIFSSQPRFAAYLESLGVEVPLKRSATTNQLIPALAKGDREFRELCEDPNQSMEVQAALALRLESKSTIAESRCQRLLQQSRLPWPQGASGWFAVPLKYYGARTGRLSGDDRINVQNLPRGSQMRAAIEAPPGHRIVHRDLSQVEARMVAWLADCKRLLEAFRAGRDVYCDFGMPVYGRVITKADALERFVCKTGILGLGYGCGPPRFRHMLFIGSGGMSTKIDEQEAERIVYDVYRAEYPEIPVLWKAGGGIVNKVIELAGRETLNRTMPTPGPHIPIECGPDCVYLPNGMYLSYPELHWERNEEGGSQAFYKNTYGGWAKLYGAKFIENLSQALSRIIMTDIAVRVFNDTGYHPFLSTHDSLDYCVPESEVEQWDKKLEYEFSVVPAWAEGLPLASEGGWGFDMLQAEQQFNN